MAAIAITHLLVDEQRSVILRQTRAYLLSVAGMDPAEPGKGQEFDRGAPHCVWLVRAQKAKQPTRAFAYESKPIRQVSARAWYRAPKRTGIEDFRWHDPRHTWASWHVPSGTPLFALQELAGLVTEKTMPATWKVTAQMRHNHRTSATQPDCKHLENIKK